MFNAINEEQYLNIIDFSKTIYRKDVIKNSDVLSPYFDYDLKKIRIDYAYQKNKNIFDSNDEKNLFKLNLLFINNELFSSIFLECCIRFLGESDIKKIKLLFILRNHYLQDAWSELVNYIIKTYNVNEKIAILKITEILSFANLYYKPIEEEKDKAIKSLSLR